MTKGKILLYFKLTVAIILIYIVYRKVNQGQAILHAFQSANWINVSICTLLLIPNVFVQFLKWRYILRTRYDDVPTRIAAQSLLFGFTLGIITPGNLGELARGLFFKKYNRLVITGLNVIDKIFGMIIVITLGFVSLNVLMFNYFKWRWYVMYPLSLLSFILLVIIWILVLNPQWVRSFLYGINTMLPARDKIKSIISCLDNFYGGNSVKMILLCVLWYGIIILQYHVLMLAFTNVSFITSYWAVSAVLFTKLVLPISFADLGIREGAAVFYFTLFRVPQAAAFNTALLIFAINFLIPSLVGSYYVFRLRWEVRQVNAPE